jgi:hypothetical protein
MTAIVRRTKEGQENGDTAKYNGIQHRLENWNWEYRSCTTKYENEN